MVIGKKRLSTKRFDYGKVLKRRAVKFFKQRLNITGSIENYLYNIRGQSAHADRKAHEYDRMNDFYELFKDAEILKYASRVAIENRWRTL